MKTLKLRLKDKHAAVLGKTCTRCGVYKTIEEFGVRRDRGNAPKSECKKCGVAEQAAWVKQNPERAKEAAKRWRAANPEYRLAKHREDTYGLTPEAFQALWDVQDGRCAICSTEFADARASHVDHCHATNVVRGLLCRGCNVGLGVFKESPDRLTAAIVYLNRLAEGAEA